MENAKEAVRLNLKWLIELVEELWFGRLVCFSSCEIFILIFCCRQPRIDQLVMRFQRNHLINVSLMRRSTCLTFSVLMVFVL